MKSSQVLYIKPAQLTKIIGTAVYNKLNSKIDKTEEIHNKKINELNQQYQIDLENLKTNYYNPKPFKYEPKGLGFINNSPYRNYYWNP